MFTDAYTHSPGATDLLTFYDAEHALGGIVGYEVAETTDENPERVAVIQRLSTAYLRTALHVDENKLGRRSSCIPRQRRPDRPRRQQETPAPRPHEQRHP